MSRNMKYLIIYAVVRLLSCDHTTANAIARQIYI